MSTTAVMSAKKRRRVNYVKRRTRGKAEVQGWQVSRSSFIDALAPEAWFQETKGD